MSDENVETKTKKKYVKIEIKTECIGDASAMPVAPGGSCDGTSILPKKVGSMGDGCKIKLT